MANKKNNAFKHVLTQLVFDLIEKSGNKAMNFKQVAAKLNLADAESRDAIRDILQEEARTGGLFKDVEKGKYALKELKAFVIGKVDMTADGSAFIVPADELDRDLYIAPRKLRQDLQRSEEMRVGKEGASTFRT